jgi:hypothetical protein
VSKDCKRFRSAVNPSLCGSSQTALISVIGLVVALIVNLGELQFRTSHSNCFTGKTGKVDSTLWIHSARGGREGASIYLSISNSSDSPGSR